MDPGNKEAYLYIGKVLHELARYEDAISCFDHAIEIDVSYFDAYNAEGDSFDTLNKYEEAKACYEKASELEMHYRQRKLSNARKSPGTTLREKLSFVTENGCNIGEECPESYYCPIGFSNG